MTFSRETLENRHEAIERANQEKRRELAEALEFDILAKLCNSHNLLRAHDRAGDRATRKLIQADMDVMRQALHDLYDLPYLFEVDPT